MKVKILQFLLLAFLFVACTATGSEAQTVYVTKTGAKYHRETCHYLKYSKYEINLADAKQKGYTPCSVCKPGTTVTSKAKAESTPTVQPSQPQQKSVSAKQCSALTKAGARCKRTTTNANGRCWQHQ